MTRYVAPLGVGLLLPAAAHACPDCATSRVVRASVLGDTFLANVVMMALPILVLGMLGAQLDKRSPRGPIISAGTLLGIGLGGFIDGILLHQILQWHNMLSSRFPPTDLVAMKYNMVWDGLFHLFTWVMTVVGLALLWRAGKRTDVPWSTPTFVGSLLLGWGAFNFVEGIIDHQILGIHHVHPGADQLAWDIGFLVFGVLLVLGGWALIHAGRNESRPRGAPRVEPTR